MHTGDRILKVRSSSLLDSITVTSCQPCPPLLQAAKLCPQLTSCYNGQIEGIFSGTLSYIFNSLAPDKNFSDIVTEAKEAGFTEPDPRDDLAGMDVARKVTILAR